MASYQCTNCGYQLQDANKTPCPKCGDTRKTVNMEIPTVQIGLSVSPLRMTVQRITKEIEKNWPLIAVLVCINVLSTIPAYFLSGMSSVIVTVFFIILSTAIGYFAFTRVIKITTETR